METDIEQKIASFETNELTVTVWSNPPRVGWCDGPRQDAEEYDTLADALRAYAQGILERCHQGYYGQLT